MRILFAPAAGPEIGGGHVMRCLSLAAALKARGAACQFIAPAWATPVIERFGLGYPVLEGPVTEAVKAVRPDVLVLDSYSTGAIEEAELAPFATVLAVIDDLADRPHRADVLIDPGYGRRPEDYADFTAPGTELLLGPRHALLRPEFAGRRAVAGDPVRRVFVSFGLSDIGGIAGRAMQVMAPLAPGVRFDLAVGSTAQSLGLLRSMAAEDARIALHVEAPEVAQLMGASDLAIGAGGGGTWERACLGLPSIAAIVADNQRPLIERLDAEGALLAVDAQKEGWEGKLAAAFERMLGDAALRRALAAKAETLCDGRGAERAAEAILALVSRS